MNKDNIRKEYYDVIYPTMVIRSQAETIELQEKEIERLNNAINEIQNMCKEEYYKKNTTDIDSIGLSNNIWVMIYMKLKKLKEGKK